MRLKSPLAIALCLAALAACTPSSPDRPPPGAPAIAPRSNADVMDTVADVLSWALPGAAAITNLLPIDPAAKAAVVAALNRAASEGLPAVRAAVATYRARGGGAGDCELYAASGALRDLLKGVARAMFASGYSFASEIERALSSVGAVVDDFAPRCVPDAGFYTAAGADASELRSLAERAAVEHGRDLRPFPPIPQGGAR